MKHEEDPLGAGRDGVWEGFQPVLFTQLFQMQLDEAAENLLPLSHPCAAMMLRIHNLSSSSPAPSPHCPTCGLTLILTPE